MSKTAVKTPSDRQAYIITGPTSGIGRVTALELAKHGTVVLVGRDRAKLDEMQKIIEQKGQHALSVVCDLAEPASVHRAAAEIVSLHLPIAGLLNNAGIMQMLHTNPVLLEKFSSQQRGCVYRCRRTIAIAAIMPKGIRMKSAMREPIAKPLASGERPGGTATNRVSQSSSFIVFSELRIHYIDIAALTD
jgi:NAD(P)-dependent dehydrogenase (short-subunit alcohol dehydrogenase family)